MKNQMPKMLSVALASLLFVTACKKDDSGDDCGGANANFTFMATGHQLTYAYDELFGLSGDVTYTYGEQDSNGNYKVSISGNPKPSLLAGINEFYYRACGDKFVADLEAGSGSDNWSYKANAQAGDSWTHAIDGGGSAAYNVLQTGLTVNTLAGAIPDCAKITYYQEGTINTDTIYWSDAVGWVKYDGLIWSYELKSKNF